MLTQHYFYHFHPPQTSAKIRLHQIFFVFHDGLRVRFSDHWAINSCRVMVGRQETLQVWPQSITVHVLVRHWGGGSRNSPSWVQKYKQFWHVWLFYPDVTSLFFNYVSVQGPFIVPDVRICRPWQTSVKIRLHSCNLIPTLIPEIWSRALKVLWTYFTNVHSDREPFGMITAYESHSNLKHL